MVHVYTTAAVATVGFVGSAYAAYKIYQTLTKVRLPEQWKQIGTLSHIYVYPVKSCGPVIVDRAECTILGLRNGWLRDRVLMVVDEKNVFVTARQYPEMLLVTPSVNSSILTLRHANMEPLLVNLAEVLESKAGTITAEVWSVPLPVHDCGLEASDWFSKVLGRPPGTFKLVYYTSQKTRPLRPSTNFDAYKFTKNDSGALPDEVPFNLINEASVEDLKSKINDGNVSHRNFRANFVLKGANAYDEDNWKYIKVGESIFEIIKPCTRCVLTTIDPETGQRSKTGEPLKMLKSYRQVEAAVERKSVGESPRMGLQMALRSGPGGVVSLNDPIYIPAQL